MLLCMLSVNFYVYRLSLYIRYTSEAASVLGVAVYHCSSVSYGLYESKVRFCVYQILQMY